MRSRQQPNERTYTFAHRQRLLRTIDVYLRWCYRQKTAARTSELAARAGVHPQYLSGIAPAVLGKRLLAALREKQLNEAERLLRHTPLSVEEIALRSAFGTPSTLHRWFLDRHGITPAAFRELKK
jgi:AraC-like DNA-binding protein